MPESKLEFPHECICGSRIFDEGTCIKCGRGEPTEKRRIDTQRELPVDSAYLSTRPPREPGQR